MRRVVVTVGIAALVAFAGCGSQNYEKRLELTLDRMRYEKRLNDNLMPPPAKTDGKYEELFIYIRPPKKLFANKVFTLATLEPDKFDLEGTFAEGPQALHVLARVERAKAATKKKAAVPAPTNRGEFTADVIAVLNSVYSTEIDVSKGKAVAKKNNNFKHFTLDAGDKNVQVYIYGAKKDPYQVVLIFEYPKGEQAIPISKIDLCLESFAVGAKAQKYYAGSGEEETASPTAPGAF